MLSGGRRRIRVIIVGLLAVGFVLFLQDNNWFQPRITQAQVRQAIHDNLPMGSTVAQTVALMTTMGAETSTSAYANRGASSSDGFEQRDPNGSTLTASFPYAYPGILTTGGIYMKFGFNAKGRLTRYALHDAYTGLLSG
jgi:hypothetical protein